MAVLSEQQFTQHLRAWCLSARENGVYPHGLTPAEKRSVRAAEKSLRATLARRGYTVTTSNRMKHAGVLDRSKRRIVLAPKRFWKPARLDRLIVLAHEFGHALTPDRNARDTKFGALMEECKAWENAFVILRDHGLRGRGVWRMVAHRSNWSLSAILFEMYG